MKKLFLIFLFLINCKPIEIINKDKAQITASWNGKVLQDYDVVSGRENDIYFVFYGNGVQKAKPNFYFYGPASTTLYPQKVEKDDTSLYSLQPEITYAVRVKFKRPGDAHLLLTWEGRNEFIETRIIYLIWEPGE